MLVTWYHRAPKNLNTARFSFRYLEFNYLLSLPLILNVIGKLLILAKIDHNKIVGFMFISLPILGLCELS